MKNYQGFSSRFSWMRELALCAVLAAGGVLSISASADAQSLGAIKGQVKKDSSISFSGAPEVKSSGERAALSSNAVAAQAVSPYSAPYNRLQFKFSHNSYERDERIEEQLVYNSGQKHQAGCRGIEFDCHQDKSRTGAGDQWRWSVHHDDEYSSGKPQLDSFLTRVRAWSDKNPGHDPIAVYFEFKDAAGDPAIFTKKFEEMVLSKLGGGKRERFFTSADMIARGAKLGAGKDLVGAAQKAGWPTLGELRGKFIVVITGGDGGDTGKNKDHYAAEPAKRIAFVDRDCGEGELGHFPDARSGNRLFLNIHVYHKNSEWHDFCKKASATKAFVTRGWKVNASPLWNDCMRYGLNMLATDKVKHHSWAAVGGSWPFRVRP